MVFFRVREKENVFALQGEEPEQKWGGIRGRCGWEQGRCRDMQSHWGSGGDKWLVNSVFVAREETEGVTGEEAKAN